MQAVPSWFVRVEVLKERLLANNAKTSWVPTYVKEKRFHNWLENAHDWAISRSRFWGTPLPVWSSEDGDEVVVIGSQAQLEELSGVKVGCSFQLLETAITPQQTIKEVLPGVVIRSQAQLEELSGVKMGSLMPHSLQMSSATAYLTGTRLLSALTPQKT